ncbi:MAG: hypothetical protein WCK90_01790 [archaeon]
MIGKRTCPECDSDDVTAVEGSGIFMCKQCGYSGTNFPENVSVSHYGEEIDEGDEDLDELVDDTKVHKIKKKGKAKKSKGAKKK